MPCFIGDVPPTIPALPSCHVEETAKIWFSHGLSADMLLVSVHGDPCASAIAKIAITSSNGELLYEPCTGRILI
jgi:hypothetical protein